MLFFQVPIDFILQMCHYYRERFTERSVPVPTLKTIVVNYMRKITLIMVILILLITTLVQISNAQQASRQSARQIFGQVEQILEENSAELERVQQEYENTCLNDARTVAYILEYNPEAKNDVEELKKIASHVEVDEIHIFNKEGVIVAGTHPQYWGYSFDSGEQMAFFKPLLTDKSLELVQEVTPNTAEGKLVQYSALWSEDGAFILEIGMHPSNVLRATKKNELSYIFSLLRSGVGCTLYAINPETETVVGSTVVADVGRSISELGFQAEQLESDRAFYASPNGTLSYCFSREISGTHVVWVSPVFDLYKNILVSELLLLAGLILVSVILVRVVTNTMDQTVITEIRAINGNLRAIQEGDLTTRVEVERSQEFMELSAHINSMVASLLQSSEMLEMSDKIRSQKEELEEQHIQLEAAVKRAEAASKAKSEFLFNMSHDLRTPMNAILGFTGLALASEDEKVRKEYLQDIDISSKQLLDIINSILELSRIENNQVLLDEELVNVQDTYNKLYAIFDSDLKKKHLSYTADLHIRHPYMFMDTTLYSQIVLNIVSNAIKYTPDGGAITLSARELDGDSPDTCFLETVIADNGIGMSQEFLSQVYDSFTRERTSTASGIQGTGLGLAIVKNLVGLMRGTIHMESTQGKGTKVTIRIPHRLGNPPAAEEPETLDDSLFAGKRILLAEDIDINALIATKLLTGRGFLVERAKDGVECVDMALRAETGYYDLILMDIQMPNMDGYRATRSIRAFADREKASIPILALTANAFREDQERALEAGMNAHVAKPLDAARMFRAIAQALQESEQQRTDNKK